MIVLRDDIREYVKNGRYEPKFAEIDGVLCFMENHHFPDTSYWISMTSNHPILNEYHLSKRFNYNLSDIERMYCEDGHSSFKISFRYPEIFFECCECGKKYTIYTE